MEIITMNLAANETKQFRKAGSYIEILSSVGAIGVNLYTSNGGQTDSIKGGLSGLYMRSDFGAFDVTEQTGAAQTVQLLICDQGEDGGSRRQPGNVRVIDEITDAITTYQFNPPKAVAAFQVVTVVPPAANTKGLIVRQAAAYAQSGAGGSASANLIAAKTTPTTWGVPAQQYLIAGISDNAATLKQTSLNMNKLLPAGWGIYAISDIAIAAASQCGGSVGYEILQ